MKSYLMFTSIITLFLLMACGNPTTIDADSKNTNYLTMKINGVEWKADHGVFGAFHPPGYNKVIIIAGDFGPKDKTEQAFNLNIYNTTGPGQYSFVDGNVDLSVAQMGSWSEQDYLCGAMFGCDMKVNVTKASSNPSIVEATFSGTLTCPSGPALTITDGKFSYRE